MGAVAVRSEMTGRDGRSCKNCIHFFVTYDPQFPYGCRSMGFKSRRYPHFEVLDATGEPCHGFEVRLLPDAG
jgi:hypothetical protein